MARTSLRKSHQENNRRRFIPRLLLFPFLFPLLQPLLGRAIRRAAKKTPEIFERLGEHGSKLFLINPVNLPFVFLLQPDLTSPQLKICRRGSIPAHDAAISGTFLTLLDMVEGKLDGDALFFSRRLSVTGDVEAVVVLRNALDDTQGSIIVELMPAFTKQAVQALHNARRRISA